MKTVDVNVMVKKRGRPPKIKRGRPKRIMFPELPKPAQLTLSFGCSVNGCTNTERWMYTLPEADDLRDRWLEFLSRPNWIADHRTRVCEVHFERQMWKKTRNGQRTLREDAVPTLYEPECGDAANRRIEVKRKFVKHLAHNCKNPLQRMGHQLHIFLQVFIPRPFVQIVDNFVDMVNFENPEVFIKSELLEPEIEVSQDPESLHLNRSSIRTKGKTEFLPKSRRQQYLINIKKNPAKYALYLERERLRHRNRRKSEHSLPHSDNGLKKEDIDMHDLIVRFQAEESFSQNPSIKVEPLFHMEEESIVPDLVFPCSNNVEEMEDQENKYMEDPLVSPSNNNVEEIGNLELENVEVNSNDLPCHLIEEKGYRCPLCKKHLARKGSMKYHLEKTHPFDETAQRLAADLKTRFKFRKREDILKEWFELFPDLALEASSVSSTLALTSNNSPVVTNVIPEKSTLGSTSTESPDKNQLLKSYILWKDQLESKTKPTLHEDSELNPKPFHIISSDQSQPQLETFSTLSIQQLLESNSEVYDPMDAKKDKSKNEAKDASSYMFCASLRCVPIEKRSIVKQKLMELVNAVIIKNLDPERIIIAYLP